ncbi:MAG: hypothetical protein OEZ06_04980 [Myxococcales bacterium]|nr:hypothetical protein [Myxococcales bacterium]
MALRSSLWVTLAGLVAAAPVAAEDRPAARSPGMEDGRGVAVGAALEVVGLDEDSQEIFDEDAYSLGIGGWLRYDVWRPGDRWALGLLAGALYHSQGEGAQPPSASEVAARALGEADAEDDAGPPAITAERSAHGVYAGLELRHGLLPWLIPFVRVSGGVTRAVLKLTDPSQCAKYQPLMVPGVELPPGPDGEPLEICSAYRIRSYSSSPPFLQTTLGLTLRPAPDSDASRIIAGPVALSVEGGYVLSSEMRFSVDGLGDEALAERLSKLNPSAWLMRVSLHVWF